MDKQYLTVKTLLCMLCVLIIVLLTALTVYTYQTPKVYVTYAAKGTISGTLYDCVISKEALYEGDAVYIVSAKDTVLGKQFKARVEYVFIEAEENGMAAVSLDVSSDMMIVLAHDGRLKGNGDVLVYRS